MPTIFYDGMPNVNEKLNELYANFAAGPYNALPLTGGNLTGPVSSNSDIRTSAIMAMAKLKVGPENPVVAQNVIRLDGAQGVVSLSIANCADFFNTSGAFGNSAATAFNLGMNSVTSRSLSAGGTLNASGADYAEYMVKRADCGTVVPGQIVGIDGEGKVTDRWDMAISFAVKSTNPCMVGGDTWAEHLGPRPEGDQAEYDAALEAARQTVDRIAFAGQVPVNVQGAEPGDYIVPVADGSGIGALLVREDDLTLKQLLRAVGKVIAIEEDGRARIIVKAV